MVALRSHFDFDRGIRESRFKVGLFVSLLVCLLDLSDCGTNSRVSTSPSDALSNLYSSTTRVTDLNSVSSSKSSDSTFGTSEQTTSSTFGSSTTSTSTVGVSSSVPLVQVVGTGWTLNSGIGGIVPDSCRAIGGEVATALPDPNCTPGAVNADVSQANLATTICSYGFSEQVRPPFTLTEPAKYALMRSYGYGDLELHSFELDHLVPLELGGATTYQNLWPELNDYPAPGFLNSKDEVENKLHSAVCDGTVSLRAAQLAIASDWVTALKKLGLT